MKKLFILIIYSLLSIHLTVYSQKNEKNTNKTDEEVNNLPAYKFIKSKELFDDKKFNLSLKTSLELLTDLDDNSNQLLKYKTLFLIGDIFSQINDNNKAIEYYKKAILSYSEYKKSSLVDNDELNILNEEYSKLLLKLGSEFHSLEKKDSAIIYYKKILDTNFLFNNDISRASALNNLSNIYREDSLFDLAKIYSRKAIDIYKKSNNRILESAAIGNLANVYIDNKNYRKAKELYTEGINLIKKDTSNKANKYKEHLYYNLAYTLYLLKDYKAYEYQEKSYNIKDKLRDKDIRRILAEVYTEHELNLEKEKTALAEEQRKLIEAKDYKMSLLFGVLSLLVIIISGVVIYNYKLRQNNLKLKLSESRLLQQQSIEKLKSEAQVKILNATIDAKENERKQIAETLHDNVSALLSSANMHLRASKKQFGDNQPQEIDKTQTIILEASQKVRDLSHNLVSSILLKFGLEYALKDIAKKYSNSQLYFEVDAKNINRYNQEFEIKIFNVIQELINNILKHSKANQAKIAISEKENQLTILVKDDGVGFTTSSSSLKDGIGLNQIEARVQVMNGKLLINSEPNKGTEVKIIVPILQEKKAFTLTSVS